ncbi:unnamed protein product [Sphacelaria rigidula]
MDDIEKLEFREAWLGAMQAELGSHEKTRTFSIGPVPEGVDVILAKWTFSPKSDADDTVTKAKARLVARGFGQRFAVDYFENSRGNPVHGLHQTGHGSGSSGRVTAVPFRRNTGFCSSEDGQ